MEADGGNPGAPTPAELVETLLSVAHELRRAHNSRLSIHDASVSRARAMRLLADDPAIPMRRLAAGLGVTGRAATVVVDGLERDGLAVRRSAPGDRRSILVELTDAGRAHIADVRVVQRRLADEFAVPLTDAERATLVGLLRRLQVHALRSEADSIT